MYGITEHEMSQPPEFNPANPQALLVVISGPSGVGKDSVLHELKQRNVPLSFVVTATTRPPRQEEVEGVDYFFVSPSRFAEMIEQGELLEYALVYNDFKGIPKQQIRQAFASGKDVVLRVDVQGAKAIRQLCPEALLIFLTVEDEQEITNRLSQRRTESEENRKLRLTTIRQELKRIGDFDYIIPNREGKLSETVDIILAIMLAEHHRVKPRVVTL
jgi:guanylate kinase